MKRIRRERPTSPIRILLCVAWVYILCCIVGSARETADHEVQESPRKELIGSTEEKIFDAQNSANTSEFGFVNMVNATTSDSWDMNSDTTPDTKLSTLIEDEGVTAWDNITGLFEESRRNITINVIPGANVSQTNQEKVMLSDFHQRIRMDNQPDSYFEGYVSSCLAYHGHRICSCDFVCTLQNNCCYDSDHLTSDIDSRSLDESAFSCFTDLNSKWLLNSPGLLMSECALEWPEGEISRKCVNPSTEEAYENIPCYSNITNINYRNVYCLHCNGDSMLNSWSVEFECPSTMEYLKVNSLEKMLNLADSPRIRGCRFIVSPPDHNVFPHCVHVDVARCGHNNTSDFLQQACMAYSNPVVSSDNMVYRNIHCLKCNLNSIVKDSSTVLKSLPRGGMSILLNLQPAATVNLETDENMPVCEDGQRSVPGHCAPSFKGMRGYGELFFTNAILIHLTNKSLEFLPSNLQQAIRQATTNYIERKFSKFRPSFYFKSMFLSLNSTKISYKFVVILQEYIPMQKLNIIKDTIDSMQYFFDYESRIRVLCCNNNSHQSSSLPEALPTSVALDPRLMPSDNDLPDSPGVSRPNGTATDGTRCRPFDKCTPEGSGNISVTSGDRRLNSLNRFCIPFYIILIKFLLC